MSRKNVLDPLQIFTNASMAVSQTSQVVNIKYLDDICISFSFSGTPTGTFAVLASNDSVNFIPVTLSAVPVASGTAGNILIDMGLLSFPYIKVTYTPTSGSGTLNGFLSAKMI